MAAADHPDNLTTIRAQLPSFRDAIKLWFKIGCLSFGGPAGQIAMLHHEVVDQRHWISDKRFLHALNFCSLLPGPEAQQLATYLGWLMHGTKGGVAAGVLFIIPGALVMMVLSAIYALYGAVPLIASVFFGLKCAVLVMVIEALLRVGRRALKGQAAYGLAFLAFAGLFLFGLPFPVVVLVAGVIGLIAPHAFKASSHGHARDGDEALLDAVLLAHPHYGDLLAKQAYRGGVIALLLWGLSLLVVIPQGGVFADIGWFFSKMAVVTFGGAYAVLAYVAQEAVNLYRWLSPSEMLAGLGLAETTPGPLILVLQFVGFLAGFRADGALQGLWGGLLGALLTLWVTFTPCFAFVFLGAPMIEKAQNMPRLTGALASITCAVVGVIANLALWFGLRVLFNEMAPVSFLGLSFEGPLLASLSLPALGIACLSALCLFTFKLGVLRTLGLSSVAGLLLHLAA
jgi:chromate transporter